MSRQSRFDDPEGWYGEGGGRRVQDGEHMDTCGGSRTVFFLDLVLFLPESVETDLQ